MKIVSRNLVTGASRSTLVRSLKRAAGTFEAKVHVLPSGRMWGIKLEGRDRFYRKYQTKATAIKNAKALAASNDASILVIHGIDGRITSSVSFQD